MIYVEWTQDTWKLKVLQEADQATKFKIIC